MDIRKPCVKCGQGHMKFIIELRGTTAGINEGNISIIRECDQCKETEWTEESTLIRAIKRNVIDILNDDINAQG